MIKKQIKVIVIRAEDYTPMDRHCAPKLHEAISFLQKEQNKIPAEYRDSAYIELTDYGYNYDNTTYYGHEIGYYREETDEEFEVRKNAAYRFEEMQKQREFAELERLKKKLGVN